MDSEEFIKMRDLALSQLLNGESLTGKNGAFAPLIKQFLESALEGEMSAHLSESERSKGNKRNGKGKKTVKTGVGSVTLSTPQDRLSSFEPEIIRKRETILADNLAPKIIGLYGLGMSFRDISAHIEEMYDVSISHETLSNITDRVIPQVKEWQNRPLHNVYPVVWLDAMYYKVREEKHVVTRCVYNVLAVTTEGHKDLIGTYIAGTESSKFWLNILTDLKDRGVKDILIACTDNLNGFSEAIETVFPYCRTQLCMIHQARNSFKYVTSKDMKKFAVDLRAIWQSNDLEEAEYSLDKVEQKWGDKYPKIIKSWRENWDRLSTSFDYHPAIRKIIYTTNPVEGFHRQLRKVTKTKGAFTNDMSLMKLIYLTVGNVSKNWDKPIQGWGKILAELKEVFGDRMQSAW